MGRRHRRQPTATRQRPARYTTCRTCKVPTWPTALAASAAAAEEAADYGLTRTVTTCPAGYGWHLTRPIEQ